MAKTNMQIDQAELLRMKQADKKTHKELHQKVRLHAVPVHHQSYARAEELEELGDVLAGINLILEIKEQGDLDRVFIQDSDTPEDVLPTAFNGAHEAVLLRFAQVAARKLRDDFYNKLQKLNDEVSGEIEASMGGKP